MLRRVLFGSYVQHAPYVPVLNQKEPARTLHQTGPPKKIIKAFKASPNKVDASALISAYGKRQDFKQAKEIYDTLKHSKESEIDVVVFGTMLMACHDSAQFKSAFDVWKDMKRLQIKPDAVCLHALALCTEHADNETTKEVWSHIRNSLHANAAMSAQMIKSFALKNQSSQLQQVLEFIDFRSDFIIAPLLTTVISFCGKSGRIETGRVLHSWIQKSNEMRENEILFSALLGMYASCGNMAMAEEVFAKNKNKYWPSMWNSMISIYGDNCEPQKALGLFRELAAKHKAEARTYANTIKACTQGNCVDEGISVLRQACEAKADTVMMWTSVISMLTLSGDSRRALEVFSDMQKRGLAPNEATLVVALVACAEVGALERGQQIHQAILAHQLPLSARLDTTLISMYAKCGQLMPAYQIFCTALQAQRADVVMWNAMLSGYAQHGYADHAEQMFNQMSVVGIQPNSGSFVSLLAAFSHTGKVDAARQIYRSMATDFGIRPTKPHQYCMVAVLSRAGMFDEAKLFIEKEIQFPDVVTWMTLLNACKNAKNLAVGEWAGNQALNLNPNDPAIYVLLGSLYGEAGQHEKKAQLWKQMQERNVEMIPGMSYIEASGRVHEFFMDNDEHKRIREVKERLKVERKKIEGMGYVANTACVLQPLGSDEEKRKHLWQHSEKLAFGMGLLSLPPRSVMNIYINQRVCEDSHDAIKRMSVTSGYGVSLRDSNRFHHIMSGKCSCKDWW